MHLLEKRRPVCEVPVRQKILAFAPSASEHQNPPTQRLRQFQWANRRGSRCRSPAMPNDCCRMHGGMSPGAPRGNKNALKHGHYSVKRIGPTWPAGGRITSRPRARNQGRSLSARGLLRSHREHRRAHGLARLQVSMRLCGVFQRIGLLDLDLDRTREHHLEEILCHRREIGTGGSVGV